MRASRPEAQGEQTMNDMQTLADFLDGLLLLLFLLGMYFFPAIIAKLRNHQQRVAILVLNLLLGWTLLGWIAAMIWAVTNTPADDEEFDDVLDRVRR